MSEIEQTIVLRPLEPLAFPSTLTTLSMLFKGVFTLITPIKLSTALPSLTSLQLADQSREVTFALEDLDIPPLLESLDLLYPRHYPKLPKNWVASLPRGLLRLSYGYSTAEDASEPTTYEWPPSLSYLAISNDSEVGIVLEHLPRTVSELSLLHIEAIITQFTNSPFGLVFPWRRFFPRLTALYLPHYLFEPDYSRLLATIVLENELDTSKVDHFIASGFWDIPTILPPQTGPYPTYRTLGVPKETWTTDPDHMEAIMPTLAPLLKHTNLTHFSGDMSLLRFLPSITDISPESWANNITLSDNIESISCEDEFLRISELPANLTWLSCGIIKGSGDEYDFAPQDTFPSKLSTLFLNSVLSHHTLFNALPVTLTSLSIQLGIPEAWNLVAQRLINLESLDVWMVPRWHCLKPLSPISSKKFTTMRFSLWSSFEYPNAKAKLSEFFSESSSLFPPTLHTLNIHNGPWHSSIIATVPKSLTSLSIDGLEWSSNEPSKNSTLMPYPEAHGMSDEDLIKSLPPKLQTLGLYRGHEEKEVKPKIELIQHLPRSIRWFGTDIFETHLERSQLLPLLPSKLATYAIVPEILGEDLRPSGYLN